MDNSTISLCLSIANFLLTWGVALYMYLTSKNKATNERIGVLEDDFEKKIADHAHRLTKIEEAFAHAPRRDDLRRIHERIDEMRENLNERINVVAENMNAMIGEFRAANHTISLIHQNMLNRSKHD